MTTPRVRFAPSPTGYLHIGGVRTALFNWLWARKLGGTFVLRIEDTDQERSTDASRAAILESLQWLGLDWDEGPFLQSERLAVYREWAERLIAAGRAYRCYCTEAELDAQRDALHARDPKAGFKYPGTCRERTDEPDRPHTIRFKADRSGSITYRDAVFDTIETPSTEVQDFVLVRTDGMPLYNFGAVVDDATMRINLVARGRDHMVNTLLQIMLYRAFDAPEPTFAHLPLLLAPNGERLAKRHGAVSVLEYRDRGFAPEAVLDYLSRFGWSSGAEETRMTRAQLVDAFEWKKNRDDGRIDPVKFLAVNHEHLKTLLPVHEYAERLVPFLERRGITTDAAAIGRALYTVRERAQTFVEAADMLDPLFREPPALDEQAARKFLVAENLDHLRLIRDLLAAAGDWSEAALEAQVRGAGIDLKRVGQPLRVALTGRTATPGLFQVLHVLGRDRSLARLDRAVA